MSPDFIAQVVTVAVSILVTFLVGHKIVSPKKLATTLTYAQNAVLAAEELYRGIPDSGKAKLAHAVAGVEARTGVSNEEASMLVRAAVSQLRSMGYLAAGPKPVELSFLSDTKAAE